MRLRLALASLAVVLPLVGGPLVGPAWAQDGDDPFGTLFGEDQRGVTDDDLPEDPVDRAAALVARGRHDEAEALLRPTIEADPEDAAALSALGRLMIKTGRADEAAQVTDRLVELQPDQPEGHLLRGILAEGRGELDAAAEAYGVAATLARPAGGRRYVEALVRTGVLLVETARRDEGVAALEKALEYYAARPKLSPEEFVWVARACRAADTVVAIKKQYQKRMVEYSRRMLDQALAKDGALVAAHVEAGTLALLKYDVPGARRSFERAVELDPNHPDARVGLARALVAQFYAGEGKFGDASRNLQVALAACPTHPGAHATLAQVAATDGELDKALEHAEAGLREHPADPELLAAKAAVLLLRGDQPGFEAVERDLLGKRPRCARFYEQVANVVTLKFRYAEARDLARKALQVDPDYHPVLSTLGISLTRTGDEEEGRRVLRLAFEQDPYNVFTFNSLELFDRLDKTHTTIETDGFIIRLHGDEVAASARYVVALCKEARARLGAKYGAFPEQVLVELFPEHADFSARSVGLPGIPALGVCFGNVVTVLSANEREAVGAHSWGRTLWHELTHVATLTRTKNRIPRWLTEGLSVFEEPHGRPTWVRDFDRDILTLIDRGLLLPVAELDRGFTKPTYGAQVMMSYYQAGILCEFIDQAFGFEAVLRLLDQYRDGSDTRAAIPAALGVECEELDRRFLGFLQQRYAGYAFSPPPGVEQRQALLDQVGRSPWDVGARGALARAYALTGSTADAELHAGLALQHAERALLPWGLLSGVESLLDPRPGLSTLAMARARALRAGAGDAHLALALVMNSRRRRGAAIRHLDLALELGTRDPVLAYNVRGQLRRARNDLQGALADFEQMVRLTPPTPDLQRLLHGAYLAAGDRPRAMAALRRVCAFDSEDTKARLEYAAWAKEQDRWPEVVEVLDDINLIDPFIADAHLLLAEGLRRTALQDEAKLTRSIDEYQAALDMKVPYVAEALFGQAACLDALGQKPAALEKVTAALESDPDHAQARALKARLEKP